MSRIRRRAKMWTKQWEWEKASGRMRNSGTHSSVHVSREIWDPSKRQAADAARGRSAWSPGSCFDYKNASCAASQDPRMHRKALLTDPAAHPYDTASLSLSLSRKLSLIVKITPHSPTHICCHTPEKLHKSHPFIPGLSTEDLYYTFTNFKEWNQYVYECFFNYGLSEPLEKLFFTLALVNLKE